MIDTDSDDDTTTFPRPIFMNIKRINHLHHRLPVVRERWREERESPANEGPGQMATQLAWWEEPLYYTTDYPTAVVYART